MSRAEPSHLPWASTSRSCWPEAAGAPGSRSRPPENIAGACDPRSPGAGTGRVGAALRGLVFFSVTSVSIRIKAFNEFRHSRK